MTETYCLVDADDIGLSFTQTDNMRYELIFDFATDQAGMLSKVAMVLFAHKYNIVKASSKPNEEGEVHDVFLLEPMAGSSIDEAICQKIKTDIALLLSGDISCFHYLEKSIEDFAIFSTGDYQVIQARSKYRDMSEITIEAEDSPGVLLKITYQLDTLGFDIASFTARTLENKAIDTFCIRHKSGENVSRQDLEFLQELLNKELVFI